VGDEVVVQDGARGHRVHRAEAGGFVRYRDQMYKTLAWTGECWSWYKANGVDGWVTAMFSGSAISYHQLVKEIRAEAFEIRYRSANR
jgi:hypothetical protein